MPDITMCTNDACKRKEECFRYQCKPSPFWQGYSAFDYEKDSRCFMEIQDDEVSV